MIFCGQGLFGKSKYLFILVGKTSLNTSDIKGGCCCCSNTRSCEKVLFEVRVRLYEYVSLCRSYISRRPKLFISFPFQGLAPSNVGWQQCQDFPWFLSAIYNKRTIRLMMQIRSENSCHKCHNAQNKFVGKKPLLSCSLVMGCSFSPDQSFAARANLLFRLQPAAAE